MASATSLPEDIEDQRFIVSPAIGRPVRLFNPLSNHVKMIEDSPFNPGLSTTIIGPVNGLYCGTGRRSQYIIWNPATSEHLTLPTRTLNVEGRYCSGFGFGYDHIDDDYKVILLSYYYHAKLDCTFHYFNIFRVSEGGWRSRITDECTIRDIKITRRRDAVFVHGACHWLCTDNKSSSLDYMVLAFDVSNELHTLMKLPSAANVNMKIVAFKGCLALVIDQTHKAKRSLSFDVWVMKEYGVAKSWKKVFRIRLGPGKKLRKFLGIIGDRFYVKASKNQVISFYLKGSDADVRHDIVRKEIDHLLPYEETLVPIKR